ncbi:hypothetical protein CDD81_4772 [Ophiocordyceps australis]|uniref:DJ-1/PfpI domain-containing protein n=1 Tax=Ophiocordyceps australis TaxID=1399860 RepID=A0A2C5XIX0_9HYPO|nr:hypothetical protein CDD81_4772 [Ophiocordyceps australis]
MADEQPPPTRYAMMLFTGFQALDVFGPLDVLNMLNRNHTLELSLVSITDTPVSTRPPSRSTGIEQHIVPTHTLQTAPNDIEVLIVPGGGGTRDVVGTGPIVKFIQHVFPKLRFLLTVCTGAALAARAGVLDGRRATTNKLALSWARELRVDVDWVSQARWVQDGNVWTSSGISAGIDMMYAFVAAQFGDDVAAKIAHDSEYERNMDANHDPFAKPEV